MEHPYVKLSGCKSTQEFYSKYATSEDFFRAFPQHAPGANQMQNGGRMRPNAIWTGERWVSNSGDNGTYQRQSTFQTGGAIPPIVYAQGGMLQEYATETMQNGGSHYMKPGTGEGGGMLEEYATETMAKGGKAHHKRLSPKQKQMMMAAMQQAAQQKQMQQQGQQDPSQQPQGGQGDMQQAFAQFVQQMVQQHPEIAGAVQHHDPKIMQQLQQAFQQQMQQSQGAPQGGDPNQQQAPSQQQQDPNQGQQMQQGPPLGMRNGGNPFSNLGKFFRNGGYYQTGGPKLASDPNDDLEDIPAPTDKKTGYDEDYANSMTLSNGKNPNAGYDTGVIPMNQQKNGAMADPSNQQYVQEYATNPDSNHLAARQLHNQRQYRGVQDAQAIGNAGLMIGSYYADRKNARDTASKQMLDRQSQNAFAAVNQPGGSGDYDQYGNFRPNQQTPVKPGAYYPTSKNGGLIQGSQHDMSDAEIQQLISKGYKIQYI